MQTSQWTRRLLLCLLTLWGHIGAQPQRDMGGLHRLPYRSYQIIAQGVEVRFVLELGREGFQGFGCVVLLAVEAAEDVLGGWLETRE